MVVKQVQGILDEHVLGPAIYEKYMAKALQSGSLIPAPEPLIVGKGLDKVQEGIDVLRQGVSASKVVVLL